MLSSPRMQSIPTPPEKKCRACNADLPIDAFGIEKHSRDGRNDECKACRRQEAREWTLLNREAAGLRSAKEVVRKEGNAKPTLDEVKAKRVELDEAKANPRARIVDIGPAADQASLPPGVFSRQTLAALCGVPYTMLRKHRKLNTCGIEDASVNLRRKGHRTRVVFDAEKAGPFIEFMKGGGARLKNRI